MKLKIVLLQLGLIFGSLPVSSALAADDPPARGTWTAQPATRWEAGFLTGNGRMGAIVFGQPADETIVLNHCRMYRPLGSREIVPDLTDRMDEARQAAKTGGPGGFHNFVRQRCHELGWRSIIWTDPFHPAGVLKLAMKDPPKDARDYRMSEDFMTGEVAVRWDDSRGTWQRRLFVSRPDNVAVLALQGPPGAVSFDLALEIGHAEIQASIRSEPAPQGAWMTAHCVYVKGKGGYDLAVRVVPQGGKLECAGEKVSVAGADGCLLVAQVVPWKTPLPKDQSEAWATSAENPDFAADRLGRYVPAPGLGESSVVAYLNQEQAAELMPKIRAGLERLPADYAALLAPHAKVHGELMGRVSLDLGGGDDRRQSTDELLARSVRDGSLPPALMERMYDGCRYLAICSSGEVVPNLQGIWTGTWTPAWSGDWTLDSNLQLAMNSMCSANLVEFMEPYARLLEVVGPRHADQRPQGLRRPRHRGQHPGVEHLPAAAHLRLGGRIVHLLRRLDGPLSVRRLSLHRRPRVPRPPRGAVSEGGRPVLRGPAGLDRGAGRQVLLPHQLLARALQPSQRDDRYRRGPRGADEPDRGLRRVGHRARRACRGGRKCSRRCRRTWSTPRAHCRNGRCRACGTATTSAIIRASIRSTRASS